ncbi:MAG: hypothetical protein ACOCQT_06160 [Desulfovermiculus sp.]
MIDFPEIARNQKRINYNKTITQEIFSRDQNYLAISRDKLAAALVSGDETPERSTSSCGQL